MNIRLIRKKIKSVSNVKKITKAMQLISAIKMKKSQQQALEGRPYRTHLEKIIDNIMGNIDPKGITLLQENVLPEGRDLVIFVSSNKGLCGAFNFNLFRFLVKNLDFKNNDFITVGKKGALFITKMGGKIILDFSSGLAIEAVSAISQVAINYYLEKKYRQIIIIYNKFISSLNFEPTKVVLLPVSFKEITKEEFKPLKGEYLIEPEKKIVIDSLLKSFIEEKIREAVLDSQAAEHSARMIAMKNATDNAQDIIYNLTLLRNKIRQEKITYELLDMVTAKESMEGGLNIK